MPTTTTHFRFPIDEEDAGVRLDVFLAEQDDPPLTRSQVRRCIDSGEVHVDEKIVKAGHKLKVGEVVSWAHAPPSPPSLEAQDIPLSILYEDSNLAIVDKAFGMVVHPSFGHPDGTLVNALLHHMGDELSEAGDALRPGIVHRIDKDTSGAIVITKTDTAHRHLSELFRTHDIERAYHALVIDHGLDDSGTFATLHGRDPKNRFRFTGNVPRGKHATTHFKVLERFTQGVALVECRLETGRTHQIRMHFFDANCPLLGDQLYGGKASQSNRLIERQALHARTLGFVDHVGKEISVTAPYPDDFASALQALRDGKQWRK